MTVYLGYTAVSEQRGAVNQHLPAALSSELHCMLDDAELVTGDADATGEQIASDTTFPTTEIEPVT